MKVWILEHRTLRAGVVESTVLGVFSSDDKAVVFASKHLDMLADQHSWFAILSETIDVDIFEPGGENPSMLCIDRLGHLSKAHQPAYPPHLLCASDRREIGMGYVRIRERFWRAIEDMVLSVLFVLFLIEPEKKDPP